MLVLALDTTSEKGGVAIYRGSECLATVENQGPANIYSISLFQMVGQALAQAGIRKAADPACAGRLGKPAVAGATTSQTGRVDGTLAGLDEIDLFAVANGPGSFTGIRVGTAAVQAWARAFGRPVRGVSIFEAMVEQARPGTQWAIPILDARRGEFFLGCFRRAPLGPTSDGTPEVRLAADYQSDDEGWVLRPGELLTFLGERLVLFQPPPPNLSGKVPPAENADAIPEAPDQVGTTLGAHHLTGVTCLVREFDRAALALQDVLPKSYGWQTLAGTLLEAIARLGLEAHRKGITQEPADLHACYIRRPDAELNWRE